MPKKKIKCPKCGSTEVVKIVYGLPTTSLEEKAERGEVFLGGCIIMGDDDDRFCRKCRHQWSSSSRPLYPF